MKTFQRTRAFLTCTLCVTVLILAGCNGSQLNNTKSGSVTFTWVANTTWLIEVDGTRFLADAAITRFDFPHIDLSHPETLQIPAVLPDTALVKHILAITGADKGVSYILAGHGHVDHTIDLGLIADLTGADIIGSRTACLQAQAQGLSGDRCTTVEGGEQISLGANLDVHIIRWSHSGDPSDPMFRLIQIPLELKNVPEVDPDTGGIDASIDGGFPNGGGVRAFLFTYKTPQGALRWLVSDSGNPYTFDGETAADPEFFEGLGLDLANLEFVEAEGTPREWLQAALTDEGISDVDLWLAAGPSAHVRLVTEHVRPAALIPHHWGGFGGTYSDGVSRAYSNQAMQEYLDGAGIRLITQDQYLDRFTLTFGGIERDPNLDAKRSLGLPLESREH